MQSSLAFAQSFSRTPSRLLGVAILLGTIAVSTPSRADGGMGVRLTMDWGNLLEKGSALLKNRSERPESMEALRLGAQHPQLGSAWFGVAPRVSLVARDWGGARRLAGGQLSIADAMRVSRSSRMVVSRIRFGEQGTRLVPFAQLGLGQWRVDTDLVPVTIRDTEIAGQVGAGVELRVTRAWQIAAETDVTVLYREQHEPQQVTAPRLWATFLASRIEF